jgi:peptidoglycan/LPS O-acetylase OafA/YrhL
MKYRFEVLDIFRGIFASMVFFFHLSPFADTPLLNNAFIRSSDMFVDFFFVLSGFVIAYSYESLDSGGAVNRFFRKRIRRIYPLHLFMLLAFLIVEVAKQALAANIQVNSLDNPNNNIYTFITNLLLLNAFPLFQVKDVSWNIPSWSISAEMAAYLVFGLMVPLLHRLGLFRLRALFYALTLFAAAAALVRITGGYGLNYSFDYGFLRGLLGFFTGTLCYNAFSASVNSLSSARGRAFDIAEPLALALVLLCIGYGEQLKEIGLLVYAPAFFLCIFVFSFEKGFISAALKKVGLLHRIGKYSYSIYMTHALVISLFNVLFIRVLKFPPSAYSYLVVLNYILLYFVSAWTYKNVEQRFYRRRKKEEHRSAETREV